MTDAPEPSTEVVETATDPDTTITLDMARLAFGLVDPELLYGVEREDYERVKQGLAGAGPEHAKDAWEAAIRLLDYLPLDQLGDALARLPQIDDQTHKDADYLLTWGLWDHRASSSYREGIDYFPGEVEEDWRPTIDGPDALEAFYAMANELGVEHPKLEDPDHWRRYRLHGRVLWSVAAISPADRAALKDRLAARGLSPAALAEACDLIDRAYVPERFRDV